MEKVNEILSELKEIRTGITELREEVGNFLGFFERNEEEIREIEGDIEAYKMGELETVNVAEARRFLDL